ncbi:aminoglycoside phosphotransferase [Spongisporangium articulatum]|uniref:Maltokinase n=1 Tax=Spongisporangium articulatum TaxID=3362603 RepID=A0ABW8ANC2_9ACTN
MTDVVIGAEDVAGLLASWLPRQRWFASGGGGVTLTLAGHVPLSVTSFEDEAGDVHVGHDVLGEGVVVHLVNAAPVDGGAPATYCVPLTYHRAPVPELAHALVGELATADGDRWVYDGPHDPRFVHAWIELVGTGAQVLGGGDSRVRGLLRPGESKPDASAPATVLSGEQSNTSVIVGPDGPDPLMVKVFRVLQPGRNPDVVVPSALTGAGCDRVPRLVGWVEGGWLLPSGEPAWGHLSAFAEFVAGARDGWKLATGAVHAGETFSGLARSLGEATASVHATLARALPTRPSTPATLEALAGHLQGRLTWALGASPVLAEYAVEVSAVIESVGALTTAPDLQMVHGDLHLGQCLHSETRGWVLLDFEGEPLRPLAERLEPDLALRDVAGMLRSFDYAARHATLGLPEDDPRVLAASMWAAECREAYLSGYAEEAGTDPREHEVLLRALELDKALYETVYETRHRPGWVEVPLKAVARLL